ncbi:MAG: hypothetical protein JSS51_00150 [Planctomycetes bacterium]|nr:hypothetical protein [Planctomycetota bacterium]
MMTRRSIPVSRLLGAFAAGVVALHALADQPALQLLDSDSVEMREKTCVALKSWAGSSPDKLLSLISPSISAEQRESLVRLAREVFRNSPRGAIGVSFGVGQVLDEEIFDEGIPIAAALPNFDSSRVLKSGDLLRAIDGSRIRTLVQCQIATISRDPGQLVQVDIERDGRPMRVALQLGSRAQLREARGREIPSQSILELAWKERLNRTTASLPRESPAGELPNVAWVDGDRLSKEPPDPEAAIRKLAEQPREVPNQFPGPNRVALQRSEVPEADMVATGTPRARVGAPVSQVSLLAGNPAAGQNLQLPNRELIRQQLDSLRTENVELLRRMEPLKQLVDDPQTPRETRQLARQEIDAIEAQILEIQIQTRALQQLLRQR